MGVKKLIDADTLDNTLTSLADTIRSYTNTTDKLSINGMQEKLKEPHYSVDDIAGRNIEGDITINVEDVGKYAFHTTNIKSVSAPNAKSINNYAFAYCTNLEKADFPSVTQLYVDPFSNCVNLKELNLPSLTSTEYQSSTGTAYSRFTSLIALEIFNAPNLASVPNGLFDLQNSVGYNYSFNYLYLPKAVCSTSSIFPSLFYNLRIVDCLTINCGVSNCINSHWNAVGLVLRASYVRPLSYASTFKYVYRLNGTYDKTYNAKSKNDFYVYVPKDLITEYESATNWSTLAGRYRAMEDYSEDGTLNTKISFEKAGITLVD